MITSDLGDYALSADSLVDFSVRLSIIVGEYDFTVPSDYRIISEIANSCSEIKASGHFPNLESPSEYINMLRSLLRQ